jgi:hypothetical protein
MTLGHCVYRELTVRNPRNAHLICDLVPPEMWLEL